MFDFIKPFVVQQVEQLPQTLFTLWAWAPQILQVVVAIYVIRTLANWFSAEYRDLPILNVEVPQAKGGPVKEPFKFDSNEIVCYCPSNMQVLGTTHVHTKQEVYTMVEKARVAQKAWAKTTLAERRRVLRTLLQFIVTHQEDFIEVSVKETGKTRVEAAFGEVFVTLDKIRYLCSSSGENAVARDYRNPGIMMHKSAYIDYVPYGAIGIIIPWNFPLHNAISHIATALFTGNASIVKVSEWASWSVHYLDNICKELMRKTGHSTDLIQFVTGYAESGAAVVDSVNKVFFIGSPQVGKKVMEAASKTLTPVTLELGGKDPYIVCEDADLDYCIDIGLRAAFFNCGQNCLSAERFYVYDKIYDKFVNRVKELTPKIQQGPDMPDIGAINMPLQLDKYTEFIEDAVKKGAKILVGGKPNPNHKGHFFQPTILIDVNHSMKIMKEETFGPVMAIMKVHSDEEVVKLANDCSYGLSCSIFSANYKRAHKIAEQIESGGTVINDWGLAFMCTDLPFGGVKISGFGKFNGPEGIRDFCYQKTCVTDRFGIVVPPPKAVLSLPTSPNSYKLVIDAVPILYERSIFGKISAVGRLLKRIVTRNF